MLSGECISFKGVSKKYGEFEALKNISFTLPANKIIGLIGSNGSGKTTLINCLLNYYNDYSGEIEVFGRSSREVCQRESLFSYIPDSNVYYEELTVLEHFKFIAGMYDNNAMVEQVIKDFGLSNYVDKFPHELSKGNRQKLQICCAILREYEILVADEPFTSLDPKQIKSLKEKFTTLRDLGKTIIISTHLLGLIEEICDYYIMIDSGYVVAHGEIEKILKGSPNCDNLEDLYLYLSDREDDNV